MVNPTTSSPQAESSVIATILDWRRHYGSLARLDDPAAAEQRRTAADALAELAAALDRVGASRKGKAPGREHDYANTAWRWSRLIDDRRIRAGWLTFERGGSIPLHDHPGGAGAQLVVSGRVEVAQYDIAEAEAATRSRLRKFDLSELETVWTGSLEEGEAAFVTRQRGNIHRLTAPTGARLLEVFWEPYPTAARTWFVLTTPKPNAPDSLFTAPIKLAVAQAAAETRIP